MNIEDILRIVAANTGKRVSLSNSDLDCYIAVAQAAHKRALDSTHVGVSNQGINGCAISLLYVDDSHVTILKQSRFEPNESFTQRAARTSLLMLRISGA